VSDTLFSGVAPTTTSPGGNPGSNQGIDFTAAHTGTVDAIQWWQPPAGGPAAVTGTLYDTQTGAVVATAPSAGPLTANAWNSIALTPAAITPGRLYTAAVFAPGNPTIGFTPGLIAGHTYSGDLTAPLRTGRFANGAAAAFPGLNTGTDAFGVDLFFTQTQTCPDCPACPPTDGFFINLTSPGLVNAVTGVGQCVIDALGQTPAGAPCRQCLLLPTQIIPWDNCGCLDDSCTGQVALAIRSVYNSNKFPQPATQEVWAPCPPRILVYRVAVSVTRCVPTMDDRAQAPACAEELAAAITLENDRTAVRQAINCCLSEARSSTPQYLSTWSMGESVTVGEQGACAGVETEFFIGVNSQCGC
jgi:hypothetical protein